MREAALGFVLFMLLATAYYLLGVVVNYWAER